MFLCSANATSIQQVLKKQWKSNCAEARHGKLCPRIESTKRFFSLSTPIKTQSQVNVQNETIFLMSQRSEGDGETKRPSLLFFLLHEVFFDLPFQPLRLQHLEQQIRLPLGSLLEQKSIWVHFLASIRSTSSFFPRQLLGDFFFARELKVYDDWP